MSNATMHRAPTALAIALTTLIVVGCSGPTNTRPASVSDGVTGDSITIGVISDITGPSAANQLPYANGVKAYFAALNEKGGIGGRKINVVVEDDKLEIPKGVAAYKKFLTQDPALAVMGVGNTALQAAIAEQSRANDLPIVGAQFTSKEMVSPFNKNYFALACTYADQADVGVPFLIRDSGAKKPTAMAVIPPTASGKEWNALIKSRIEAAGGTFLGDFTIEAGALEADLFAQEVASKHPDMLFVHGAPSMLQVMMRSLKKFGIKEMPILGTSPTQSASIPEAGEGVASNYYTTHCYSAASAVDSPDLVSAAKAASLAKPDYDRPEFTQGYVAAWTLATAIAGAGDGLTRASLKTALENIHGLDTGGLAPAIGFSAADHLGVKGARPYKFDSTTKSFVPVGKFDDYSKCVTNEYVSGSADSWSAGCIK